MRYATGVTTQGRHSHTQRVTSYAIAYGYDGISYVVYRETTNIDKVCTHKISICQLTQCTTTYTENIDSIFGIWQPYDFNLFGSNHKNSIIFH